MYSLKLAHLLKEHTGAEIYNFYIDMRTPGKGYEEFYDKLLEEGVHFIRGRVGEVTDWAMTRGGRQAGHPRRGHPGRRGPPHPGGHGGAGDRARAAEGRAGRPPLFNMSCGSEGFFLERHPKLAPVNTFTDGIFIAGCCQGPRDIPDTVAQAGAAAAEALALIDTGYVEQEPNTAYILRRVLRLQILHPAVPVHGHHLR
jgi:heterodisulfide reductase subunit A2